MPLPMSRRDGFCFVALASLAMVAAIATPGRAGELRKTPVVKAVQRVQASVVSISSEKKAGSTSRWPFSSEETSRPRVSGMGSGVIVDARGYILTNQHVVDKVQTIDVHLQDGTNHLARVIQVDKELDLALIKVEAGRPLSAVPIGNSADLMVGETVITIGNAFGYENTVSVGIVSALKRNVTLSDDQIYRNLIQTDACINPGNSGGPLINIEGELVGINVATRSGAQGIGFALPIDDVKRVATEMLSIKRLSGTWHGMVTSEVLNGEERKVVLQDVQGGSSAADAGILVGDHVMKVGEINITNPLDIERGLLDVRPGQPTAIVLMRNGKPTELSLDVKPASRTSIAAASSVADPNDQIFRTLGVKLQPVSAQYVSTASPQLRGGLYVMNVVANSPAARANVQQGDILVGVNVGKSHWETISADTVVYTLRQPEVTQTQVLPFYIVRRNNIHQGRMSLVEATADRGTTRR